MYKRGYLYPVHHLLWEENPAILFKFTIFMLSFNPLSSMFFGEKRQRFAIAEGQQKLLLHAVFCWLSFNRGHVQAPTEICTIIFVRRRRNTSLNCLNIFLNLLHKPNILSVFPHTYSYLIVGCILRYHFFLLSFRSHLSSFHLFFFFITSFSPSELVRFLYWWLLVSINNILCYFSLLVWFWLS